MPRYFRVRPVSRYSSPSHLTYHFLSLSAALCARSPSETADNGGENDGAFTICSQHFWLSFPAAAHDRNPFHQHLLPPSGFFPCLSRVPSVPHPLSLFCSCSLLELLPCFAPSFSYCLGPRSCFTSPRFPSSFLPNSLLSVFLCPLLHFSLFLSRFFIRAYAVYLLTTISLLAACLFYLSHIALLPSLLSFSSPSYLPSPLSIVITISLSLFCSPFPLPLLSESSAASLL